MSDHIILLLELRPIQCHSFATQEQNRSDVFHQCFGIVLHSQKCETLPATYACSDAGLIVSHPSRRPLHCGWHRPQRAPACGGPTHEIPPAAVPCIAASMHATVTPLPASRSIALVALPYPNGENGTEPIQVCGTENPLKFHVKAYRRPLLPGT